ncbi:MAG: PAS domain S-box protein [Ignavibacteriales bacterium]|nr:PAS domain S-box protein [Ignavibacteriales bacterium]
MKWKFIEMFLPPRSLDEDENRIRQIIHTICLSITFLIFIPMYTRATIGHWNTVYTLLLEEVLLWFTLWLNYRGNLKWASRMLVVSVFILETLLILFAGEGSRDISILIYPVSIVIAGLLLSKRSFFILTVAIIFSFALIMIAEVKGLIIPSQNLNVNTRDIMDMIIILMVTAVIVSFLTENLRQSVARNRALLSALPDLVFRLNRDGTILDFSAPRDQTLVSSPQEFLGKKIQSLLPDSIASQMMAITQAALKKKSIQESEYELPIQRKKEYWEARVVALTNDEVVVVLRDISERKQAEDQRRMSEERFSQVFMTSPDSLTLLNMKNNVYIDVNDGFTRQYGYTREEVIGHSAQEINIWKNMEDPDRIMIFLQNQHRVENIEIEFINKQGISFTGLLSASTIRVAGEACMISVVRDITDQKKLQNQLLQTQKIQSIGTLAGGIAHDFNNILGIIFGYADLVEKNRLDAVMHKEGMSAIVQAVERGAALVDQILAFARRTEVNFLPLNIPMVMQEVLSMLKQTFPKTITFTENYAEDLPAIMGDKTQIHQTLMNLCINARDAMPHGGCITIDATLLLQNTVRERFPTAIHPSYVCLRITDTGSGMDEAILQRIFDPFFTTKEYGKGTGLGLSVVYGIIHSHEGFISVESNVGKGSTFSLFFPATNFIGGKLQKKELSPAELPCGTETILIVEDEELILGMLHMILRSHDYSIFKASDGEKALKLFTRYHEEIALVLSDLGLPKMNGIDTVKKMKEIDPNVQFIVASGYLDERMKWELKQLGIEDFIQKPYRNTQLLLKIREVLDRKKNELNR